MTTETALLDIKLLRLLDQLYITRRVTRSAEALGQSQPTVSIWLVRLREVLAGLRSGWRRQRRFSSCMSGAGFYQQTL